MNPDPNPDPDPKPQRPQREKLEVEALMREAIQPEQRNGLLFVFRRGSPLDPQALRMVAADQARTIIICGDYSR